MSTADIFILLWKAELQTSTVLAHCNGIRENTFAIELRLPPHPPPPQENCFLKHPYRAILENSCNIHLIVTEMTKQEYHSCWPQAVSVK